MPGLTCLYPSPLSDRAGTQPTRIPDFNVAFYNGAALPSLLPIASPPRTGNPNFQPWPIDIAATIRPVGLRARIPHGPLSLPARCINHHTQTTRTQLRLAPATLLPHLVATQALCLLLVSLPRQEHTLLCKMPDFTLEHATTATLGGRPWIRQRGRL